MEREARRVVQEVYEAVGRDGSRAPEGLGAVTGGALARALGYPAEDLAAVPGEVLDAFVGVAPLATEVQGEAGAWVLDLGCGAGLDALLLCARGFRVAALDAAPSMLRRLRRNAPASLLAVRADLPALPFRDSGASWVLLNGVANTVPDRRGLLAEVRRALAPGGFLLAADLVQTGPLPDGIRGLPEAWAWCVAGAATEETWRAELAAAGFGEVEVRILEDASPLARTLMRARAPGLRMVAAPGMLGGHLQHPEALP